MNEKVSENSPQNGLERNSSSAIAPMSTSLPDSVLEKLLSSYSLKQKRSALVVFLAASVLFDVWAIAVPQGQKIENLGKHVICFHYTITASILIYRIKAFFFMSESSLNLAETTAPHPLTHTHI